MSDIRSLIGGEQESKFKRFKALSKGRSAKEKRKLEQKLLRPERIKPYTGEKPGEFARDPLLKSTIKFVFVRPEELALVKRTLPVSEHVEMSVANHGLLIALLKEVDEGRISYDKKEKTIAYVKGSQKHRRDGGSRNKRSLHSWKVSKGMSDV